MAKGQSRTTQQGKPSRTLAVLVLLFAVLLGGVALTARGSEGTWVPKLGLDLQGGSSITLTPKTADVSAGRVTDSNITTAISILRNRIDARGVSETEITSQGSGNGRSVVVSLPGRQDRALLQSLLTTAELRFRQVLQRGEGVPAPAVTPAATPAASGATPAPTAAKPAASAKATAGAKASPSATSQGRVVPRGLSAATTAPSAPAVAPTVVPKAPATTAPAAAAVPADVQAKYDTYICNPAHPVAPENDLPDQFIVTCGDDGGTQKFLLGKAEVVGKDVSTASAGLERNSQGITQAGKWEIDLEFKDTGKKAWGALTTRVQPLTPPANQVAVVLDGQVIIAPQIITPILDGKAQITGSFTRKQATDVAQQLKFGALPLTFDQGPLESISPTLGADQLRGGLIAGAIGLALVVAYLLLYYRGLGLIAVASLVVSASMTYLIVVLFSNHIGLRLSLSSIAGLIVAIGITADSFVVYFERLRDEVRDGKSLRVAVETGWRRARRTILVADFVSFLAAIVLYFLSVGGVQGFAFTLGLTTVVDVIIVFLFTKPLITLFSGSRFFGGGHRWSGLDARRLGRKAGASDLGEPARVGSRVRTGSTSLTKEA